MSLAERVLQTKPYKSGETVRPAELCDQLGASSMDIRAACVSLLERGQMERDGLHFRKPLRHWIHKRKLA